MNEDGSIETVTLRPELLLHPQIPKPLHGLAPRVIFGDVWWEAQRRTAYAKNRQHCWACGVDKRRTLYHAWLEAHETYVIDHVAGTATFDEVVALCHACHNFIHQGRMQALVDSGEMHYQKMQDILNHGQVVLRSAGLKKPPPVEDAACAVWHQWRMIINGQAYPGKFKDYAEWLSYYSTRKEKGDDQEEKEA